MRANIFFLYAATVLIWGTTWLGIKLQLGSVDPMVSVLYRFIAAAIILMVYCKFAGLKMRFRLKDQVFMALQGLVLFSVNYWIIYLASVHLTSGLVAVIFSSIVFLNMINGALLIGSPIRISVVVGGTIGIAGIVFVFWPEISGFSLSDKTAMGVLLAAISTFMASLGNIISARHQKYELPVIQTNAYGMAYGAVIMGIIVVASGKPFNFEFSFMYVGSLFGKIGADRAAYATMLFPIVALVISTFFEDYQWSAHNIIGMVLVLMGNGLVINKKALRMKENQ
jgi:drug/metabolite transporter (DMT)-like permease